MRKAVSHRSRRSCPCTIGCLGFCLAILFHAAILEAWQPPSNFDAVWEEVHWELSNGERGALQRSAATEPEKCKYLSVRQGFFVQVCEDTDRYASPEGASVMVSYKTTLLGQVEGTTLTGQYTRSQRNWQAGYPWAEDGEYMRIASTARVSGTIAPDGTIRLTARYNRDDIFDNVPKRILRQDGRYYSALSGKWQPRGAQQARSVRTVIDLRILDAADGGHVVLPEVNAASIRKLLSENAPDDLSTPIPATSAALARPEAVTGHPPLPKNGAVEGASTPAPSVSAAPDTSTEPLAIDGVVPPTAAKTESTNPGALATAASVAGAVALLGALLLMKTAGLQARALFDAWKNIARGCVHHPFMAWKKRCEMLGRKLRVPGGFARCTPPVDACGEANCGNRPRNPGQDLENAGGATTAGQKIPSPAMDFFAAELTQAGLDSRQIERLWASGDEIAMRELYERLLRQQMRQAAANADTWNAPSEACLLVELAARVLLAGAKAGVFTLTAPTEHLPAAVDSNLLRSAAGNGCAWSASDSRLAHEAPLANPDSYPSANTAPLEPPARFPVERSKADNGTVAVDSAPVDLLSGKEG